MMNHALQPENRPLPVTCKCGPTSRHHAAEADIEPIKTYVLFAKGMNGVLVPSFSF